MHLWRKNQEFDNSRDNWWRNQAKTARISSTDCIQHLHIHESNWSFGYICHLPDLTRFQESSRKNSAEQHHLCYNLDSVSPDSLQHSKHQLFPLYIFGVQWLFFWPVNAYMDDYHVHWSLLYLQQSTTGYKQSTIKIPFIFGFWLGGSFYHDHYCVSVSTVPCKRIYF